MLQAIKYLIIHYGYLAIFIGTFFDSESTVLILGGFVAKLGYLDLPMVIFVSYCGVFGGDQFYFFLGRWKGKEILSRHPRWQRAVDRMQEKLGHYSAIKILVFRFLLGLRIPAPLMVGMSKVSYPRFVVVDALLLVPWAIGLCWGGYLLGELLTRILKHVSHYQTIVIGIIIGITVVAWTVFYFYQRWKK